MSMAMISCPCFFPMYTVPLGTLLDMTEVAPHETLKARDVLVEFQRNMGNAAFISHQWLTSSHPDPECKQIRVLQDALEEMMGNLKSIPVSAVSEAENPGLKPLPTSKILSEPLFFWYDYFSCPQERLSESSGCGEKSTQRTHCWMPSTAYQHMWTSAPSFLPLYQSWRIRVEPISSLHSPGIVGAGADWRDLAENCLKTSPGFRWKAAMIFSSYRAAGASLCAGSGPVGEGAFTVPEDASKLGPVLMKALKRKLLWLLKAEDLPGYRFVWTINRFFSEVWIATSSSLFPALSKTMRIWIFHPLSWSSSIRMVSAASARWTVLDFRLFTMRPWTATQHWFKTYWHSRQIRTKSQGKSTQILELKRGFHLLPFPAPSRTTRLSVFWSLPEVRSPAPRLLTDLLSLQRDWTMQKPSRFSSMPVVRLRRILSASLRWNVLPALNLLKP